MTFHKRKNKYWDWLWYTFYACNRTLVVTERIVIYWPSCWFTKALLFYFVRRPQKEMVGRRFMLLIMRVDGDQNCYGPKMPKKNAITSQTFSLQLTLSCDFRRCL